MIKDSKSFNRTMTLKVVAPVVINGEHEFAMRMDVKGMMRIIENLNWKEKDRKEIKTLLTEYSKFYILNALKVKVTPLEK